MVLERRKAAIWARVSTEEQRSANQTAQLEEWAPAKNLEVVWTYEQKPGPMGNGSAGRRDPGIRRNGGPGVTY